MKRRVYHFCNKKHGLENIRRRRVKVSTFDDLNDPFELMCHRASAGELKDFLSRMKQHVASLHGLICFSKEYTSPVQWAHYAERHKGLCLGFDIDSKYLEDVSYCSGRIDFFNEADLDKFDIMRQLREMCLVKHQHWSYEQEVRLFGDLGKADENGLHFKEFDNELVLKEVITGFDCDVSKEDLMQSLGSLSDFVECYGVVPSDFDFLMVRSQ
ncbi:DUF2971 domain-containing protein [Pseudomonas sp. GD03842]|uniref:DUF2971 domain-containing protein n=1 Tax=Pseudomonas sp. GD03842 TaxID=2975385 RepID=UPI00244D5981|nr:DUF2971 domain-containing protein [Pseudomonas sp. GD03842]MDH0745251.1 DUF2971 domain-containing protein [Pseudomonas sp. GD03842]